MGGFFDSLQEENYDQIIKIKYKSKNALIQRKLVELLKKFFLTAKYTK
jgi:hypothetical protein